MKNSKTHTHYVKYNLKYLESILCEKRAKSSSTVLTFFLS
jgi:hypothetical protein